MFIFLLFPVDLLCFGCLLFRLQENIASIWPLLPFSFRGGGEVGERGRAGRGGNELYSNIIL